MDKFITEGPAVLNGEIEVNGSKNAALKIFAASLLFEKPVLIKNAPLIDDIFKTVSLLEKLGARVERKGERNFSVFPAQINSSRLDKDIANHFRASIVFSGPLMARFGEAEFPYPGGCVIGKRPIDFFLDGFEKMGIRISQAGSLFRLKAKNLKGAEIVFPYPSVTATETMLLAAVGAKGKTVIRNAALEPEIASLIGFLNQSGAKIKTVSASTLIVEGAKNLKNLKPPRFFNIPPDRIEAGTFAVLGALASNGLRIKNIVKEELANILRHLEKAGVPFKLTGNALVVSRPKKIKPLNLKTSPYPGFPTDLQPAFTVLLTQASGVSSVFETVFEGRLNYIFDLNKMGANIIPCDPHRIIVNGKTPLHGKEIQGMDLRSGLAFVIAGLIAKGKSTISNVSHIDRGYEKIEERLQKIGGRIQRIN